MYEKKYNLVSTLAPSFLIGSSSFLQVTRTTITAWMSLKLGQIQRWTAELAALDQLKKSFTYLRTIQNTLGYLLFIYAASSIVTDNFCPALKNWGYTGFILSVIMSSSLTLSLSLSFWHKSVFFQYLENK